MKFNNGCWLKKKGIESFSPVEIYEKELRDDGRELRLNYLILKAEELVNLRVLLNCLTGIVSLIYQKIIAGFEAAAVN